MSTSTNGNGATEKICTLTPGLLVKGESIGDGETSIGDGDGFSIEPMGDVPPPQDPPLKPN